MDKQTLLIKLRALATYVESFQGNLETISGKTSYDQEVVTTACNSPGCMLGHLLLLTSRSRNRELATALSELPTIKELPMCENYTDCNSYYQIFGVFGCDSAAKDWRKAVKYVRDWCDIYEKQEVTNG